MNAILVVDSLHRYRSTLEDAQQVLRDAAKLAIDLDRGLDVSFLLNALENLKGVSLPPSLELNDAEKALVRARTPIEAIKAHRSRTGSTLSASKAAVDDFREREQL